MRPMGSQKSMAVSEGEGWGEALAIKKRTFFICFPYPAHNMPDIFYLNDVEKYKCKFGCLSDLKCTYT